MTSSFETAPIYIVTLVADNVHRREFWDSSKPMKLGYYIPWTLEREAQSGAIRLKHEKGHVVKVKNDIIKKRTLVNLPGESLKVESPVSIRISTSESLNAAFEPSADESADKPHKKRRLRVYQCSGKTALVDSQEFQRRYVGRSGRRSLFTLQEKQTGEYHLKILRTGVEVNGVSDEIQQAAKDGKMVVIPQSQINNLKIDYVVDAFRFGRTRTPLMPALIQQEVDEETEYFRKTMSYSAVAMLLLFLISTFVDKEEKEDDQKYVQIAEIKLPQKVEVQAVEKAREVKEESVKEKQAPVETAKPTTPTPAHVAKVQEAEKLKGAVAQLEKKLLEKVNTEKKPVFNKAAPTEAKVLQAPEVKATPVAKAPIAPPKPQVAKEVAAAKQLLAAITGGGIPLKKESSLMAGGGRQRRQGDIMAESDSSLAELSNLGKANEGLSAPINKGVQLTGGDGATTGVGGGSYNPIIGDGGIGTFSKGSNYVAVGFDTGNSSISGGLTREQVYKVIKKHWSEIKHCYEDSRLRMPNVSGEVRVDWTVGVDGRVKGVSVKSSTVNDDRLGGCVTQRIQAWQFPRPTGGKSVGVLFPFVFRAI